LLEAGYCCLAQDGRIGIAVSSPGGDGGTRGRPRAGGARLEKGRVLILLMFLSVCGCLLIFHSVTGYPASVRVAMTTLYSLTV